eukprot:1034507-Lingulodinium_polyedra.AAC.1
MSCVRMCVCAHTYVAALAPHSVRGAQGFTLTTSTHNHGASARGADTTERWCMLTWTHKTHHAQTHAQFTYTATLTCTDTRQALR